jgi:hypothetical protein
VSLIHTPRNESLPEGPAGTVHDAGNKQISIGGGSLCGEALRNKEHIKAGVKSETQLLMQL